ncbi:MAG: polysaccharide deacetylase family protein [Ferruginibacter sp.]
MDLYLVSTPWWLRSLFPGCTWELKGTEKRVYLSFDDGPHPEITPFVLAELAKYQAKATFFCIGDNVRKFPGTYQQVIAGGHSVGNHTMHHLNGWKTKNDQYLADIEAADQLINSTLFRPPYGRIRRSQVRRLLSANPGRKIIMWSALAGDWDTAVSPQKCFHRLQKAIYPGCIVVMHDSEKAATRLQYVLPRLLQYLQAEGYKCCAL